MLNIGIDIDNVLSNFDEVLFERFKNHDKLLRNTGVVDSSKYITKGMFDWSKEEINNFYPNTIRELSQSLDTIKGSVEFVNKLKEDGHKIYIITGRDNGEYADPYTVTVEWLSNKGFNYDKLILTNSNNYDKHIQCKKYNINIMIDDSVTMCKNCIANNINAVVMAADHNKDDNTLFKLHNWNEIYEYINSNKEKLKNMS